MLKLTHPPPLPPTLYQYMGVWTHLFVCAQFSPQ